MNAAVTERLQIALVGKIRELPFDKLDMIREYIGEIVRLESEIDREPAPVSEAAR